MTELEMAKNKQEFLRIFRENVRRDGSEDLLGYLEKSTFFQDPCSTKFHLAEPGGLCLHSLNVYHRLRTLMQHEKPPGCDLTPEEEESIAIVALTHDLCKIGCYQATTRNQKSYDPEIVAAAQSWQLKHDQQGDFIWVSVPGYTFNDPLPYGHGEKSVYIISAFMKLKREEALAIRWHMSFASADFKAGGNNVGAAFGLPHKIIILTSIADLMATYGRKPRRQQRRQRRGRDGGGSHRGAAGGGQQGEPRHDRGKLPRIHRHLQARRRARPPVL